MQPNSPNESHGAPAHGTGALLIAATVLSVFAMAHHPSVSTPDLAQALEQIKDMTALAAWVHGTLIALMLVIFCALTEFSLRRGVQRPLIRAGLVAYGAGVVAMIGAASISGFVTPHVAVLVPSPNEQDLRVIALLINFCHVLNQTMANIGAVAMSAGILAWSLNLLRGAGPARIVGAVGVLIGLSPALALIFGGLHLNVHGMLLVVVLQGLWTLGVGILLLRGDV